MTTSLIQPASTTHHPRITEVERDRLADDLKRPLLQVPAAGDQKIINRKKDIAKGFNRVADTLAHLMTHAFQNGREDIPKQFVNAIGDFFASRTQRVVRRLSELFAIETKEEGELNILQMAIAQGDRSTPTMIRLITEVDEVVAVLLEIRAAAVTEVQRVAERTGST